MSALRQLIVIGVWSLLIASCSEPGSASLTAPTPQPGTFTIHTLSGVVSGATPGGLVPLAGATIDVSDCYGAGCQFRYSSVTDGSGHYSLPGVSDRSGINVKKYGYKSLTRGLALNGQTTLDIQLDPNDRYSLSGVVTETTPAGAVPVEGALVTGSFDDPVYTDKDGFFSIPDGIEASDSRGYDVYVIKDGYQTFHTLLPISADTRYDVQLVRK